MLSEQPITVEQFNTKVKEFAQELINRVAVRFPDVTLQVVHESPRSALIIVNPKDGEQITQLKLGSDGLVEAMRVYQ